MQTWAQEKKEGESCFLFFRILPNCFQSFQVCLQSKKGQTDKAEMSTNEARLPAGKVAKTKCGVEILDKIRMLRLYLRL